MSKVVKEEKGPLHLLLAVNIEQADYEQEVKEQLNEYRKKAHFKGFRKGKTPMGFIKKMYGHSILSEVVNRKLQQYLYEFIEQEGMEVLGQPIPAENHEQVDLDIKTMGDFSFQFEVGLAPAFELQGIDSNPSFEKYVVDITDEMIEDDLLQARKEKGETQEVKEDIDEEDVLEIQAKENDGRHETTFKILVKRLNDQLKEQLKGEKIGYSFRFDIYKLEDELSEEMVRKHFLQVEDPEAAAGIGREFEGTVKTILRRVPAELDDSFFEEYFRSEEVSNEEEAREFFRNSNSEFFSNQADTLLFQDIQDYLLEQNELSLPDEFLKRWLVFTNEDLENDNVDSYYKSFSRGLRWQMLRDKLVKKYDLEVTEEEIREAQRQEILRYVGNNFEAAAIEGLVDRFMGDRERVEKFARDIIADKVFDQLKQAVEVKERSISLEEFEEKVKAFREKMMDDQQAPPETASGEETQEKEESVAG